MVYVSGGEPFLALKGRQMATATITDDHLTVRLSGWEAVFALKREISVPMRNVLSAQAGTVTALRPYGIRLPGTFFPGVIAAGSYWSKSAGWSFWSVRHSDKAVDIRLRDARYQRIVVEVDDPYSAAAEIENSVPRAR
jgi:hypothetical protein